MIFSFTSLGGKVNISINKGAGPYVFNLHGQNYHLLGSLLPKEGIAPKFTIIYVTLTMKFQIERMLLGMHVTIIIYH